MRRDRRNGSGHGSVKLAKRWRFWPETHQNWLAAVRSQSTWLFLSDVLVWAAGSRAVRLLCARFPLFGVKGFSLGLAGRSYPVTLTVWADLGR